MRFGLSLGDAVRTAVLLVPLLILALTGNWWGQPPLKSVLNLVWVPLVLAALVQIGLGLRLYLRTLWNLVRLRIDANTLVVVGASAALALALWNYLHLAMPYDADLLLLIWRDAAFGASLVAVVLLGEIGQRNAQKSAVPLRPAALQGRVVIEPGALILCDGIVQDGVSEIQDPVGADDVFPIIAKTGMRVHAGARNGDGALTIQALDSVAGAPLTVGKTTPNSLHQTVNWAARAMLATAVAMVVWRHLQPVAGQDAVADSLRLIAMSAPLGTGLVLAAPATEILNAARKLGIEIRDVGVLDRLRHIGAVVMGHRGVLVPDRLRVISAQCVDGVSGAELMRRVAAVAQLGHEPWGKAVLEFAVGYRMRLQHADEYTSSIGEGVTARVAGQETLFGTREYLESHGISCAALNDAATLALSQGRRLRWVAESIPARRAIGFVVFGAPTVSGAAEAARNLHNMGFKTAWLARTDNAGHVALAKHLKIGRVISELPEDVVEGLDHQRQKAGPILLVTADAVPDGLMDDDIVLPFGRRIMDQLPASDVATPRHDPRLIVDLFILAARYRRVVRVNTGIAFVTTAILAFMPNLAKSYSDLASYEVAIVLLIALSSLGLRAVSTTANEVDEE